MNKSEFVSQDVVERKKGESDEAYAKRVEEYNKKVEEYWSQDAMKNAKPMQMPNPNASK